MNVKQLIIMVMKLLVKMVKMARTVKMVKVERIKIKKIIQKLSGSRHVETTLKKQPTMKRVWMLHILDPQVTPRKETYFQKIKNALIYRQKNKKNNFIKK